MPAISLFAMHGNRLFSLVGVAVFLILVLVLMWVLSISVLLPSKLNRLFWPFSVPSRADFIRHVIEVGGFHAFLLYTNYVRFCRTFFRDLIADVRLHF